MKKTKVNKGRAGRSAKIAVGPTRDAQNRIVVPSIASPARTGNGNGKRPRPKAFGPGWWEIFEGARAGNYRGWFFMPTMLDSSRNINQWNRTQIASRSIWAYNNIPEVRATIDGLAVDEVDTAIWPKAMTSSTAFNKAVTNAYHQENHDARSFDLRAVEDAYSGQFLIRRSLRIFGDLFGQLVRPFPDLYGRIAPRIGFLPGYQCTSDGAEKEGDLRDGIRFDQQTGAATKFRFALPLRDGEEQKYAELDAPDVLHFHDPFMADQIRGMGTLAPVVRQMYSMDDIDKAETTGQLLRSRVAYAVETIGADEGEIPRLPGVVDTEVIQNPDGTKTIIQKVRSRDGQEVDVITPPSGMKIKTLESNRGGAIDFRNFLARGLAHCTLYPPEWVLFISGLSQGTVARVVQNRVQKIATFFRNNQLVSQFVERWYNYWLYQRIKAKAFDSVEGGVPDDWYMHRLIFPRDLSVDVGRDGRLYDDRVMRGNETPRMYHGRNSEDDDDVDEELIAKAIWRRQRLAEELAKPKNHSAGSIKYEEIWRLPPGTANVAAQAEVGTDEKLTVGASTTSTNQGK
jgi:hypothetical protein